MHILKGKSRRLASTIVAVVMVFTCISYTGGAYAASEKTPYQKGDNIKNAVFYIAVDANGNGTITDKEDAVYYYTYNEIVNAGDEVAYHFGNHGQGETNNVKGAKLSTLIDGLQGVDIKDSWIIQYMEEDAYHATAAMYQDTVQGLTDENGVGNGAEAGVAAETIIGYSNKVVFDAPDENNISDKDYIPFLNYEREASYVRGYRQTDSANTSVLKLLRGVVISNNERVEDAALPAGKNGYILKSVNSEGVEIADDYTCQGLLEGMAWPVTPNVNVPWAKLNSTQSGAWNGTSKIITVDGNLTEGKRPLPTQTVSFKFTETPFFTAYQNGSKLELLRSNLAGEGYEFPRSNNFDGTEYEFFGYNKPMYVRYQGVYLNNLINVEDDSQVYIIKEDGSKLDITDKVDDCFVAYYYTQSKSSSNISNGKRVPLNYEKATLVDTKSAEIEYSNDLEDYNVLSGKEATIYKNAQVAVVAKPQPVQNVKADLSQYNSIKVSWSKAENVDGYKVSYKNSGSWKTKTVTGTSVVLPKLTAGKTYSVKVSTFNKSGSVTVFSKDSAVKKVTTLKKVTLKAKKSGTKAVLTVSDIAGESGYQIYQKIGNGKWTLAKNLKAGSTKYTTKTLKKGKTYSFKARAYKTSGSKKIYAPWSSVKKIKR